MLGYLSKQEIFRDNFSCVVVVVVITLTFYARNLWLQQNKM